MPMNVGGIGGAIGGLASLGGGIADLISGNQYASKMGDIVDQANAFGPYRAGYAQMLQHLMQNPSDVTNMPGYAAGMQAIERAGAAAGQGLGSGALETSLFKYGGDMFNQWVNTLANLGGANIDPASLVQSLGTAAQTKAGGVSSLLGGIGGVISGIGGLF